MDEEIPNSVTAQESSISITSFVSKGVSFLIAQYMPSLLLNQMFVQTLFVHISHVNTTSPNAQIPFYWTLIAYFSPRHLTQVGRNENAYLELQNATSFNRLRNLTSNFSNTKVRIVHLNAILLGYYILVTKLRFFLSPPFKKNDFRNDFRFPSKFRLENFVIILNSLEKQWLNTFLSWTSFTSPWNGHLEFFRPPLSLLFVVVVAFFGL